MLHIASSCLSLSVIKGTSQNISPFSTIIYYQLLVYNRTNECIKSRKLFNLELNLDIVKTVCKLSFIFVWIYHFSRWTGIEKLNRYPRGGKEISETRDKRQYSLKADVFKHSLWAHEKNTSWSILEHFPALCKTQLRSLQISKPFA